MTVGSRGPFPKPEGQRRRRNVPAASVVVLPPAGRKGRAPQSPLPLPEHAQKLYRRLWHSPEATQWTGADWLPVARLALLAVNAAEASKGVLEEIRHLEDRLGLNPQARARLRWTVGGSDPEQPGSRASGSVTRLRAVDPEGET